MKVQKDCRELTPTPSLERRIAGYNEVIRLSRNGTSPAKISHQTGIDDATISGWLVNGRKPWTRYELFKPTSSEQLSYAIGVYVGDGSISQQRKRFFLRLHVKDREFASKFSLTCAQILGKKPYSVRLIKDREKYETTVANASFCRFLKQGLPKLDPSVRDHPSGFVRGLADSDGCPAITTTRRRGKPWFFVQVVVATSTSIPLLSYARTILRECFGLKATLVYKGQPRYRPYRNMVFRSKKRVFDLRISRFGDLKQFSQVVGFELSRKQEELDAAIAVRERFGSGGEAVEEWTRNWEHGRTEWIRKKRLG
jgi:intein-encoded DNA endonuclease-like protein